MFTSRGRRWRCLRFPFWISSQCGGGRDSLMVPLDETWGTLISLHLCLLLSLSFSLSLTFSCVLPLNCPSRLSTTSLSFIWASQWQDTCTVSPPRSSLLLLLPAHSPHVCYSKVYFLYISLSYDRKKQPYLIGSPSVSLCLLFNMSILDSDNLLMFTLWMIKLTICLLHQ